MSNRKHRQKIGKIWVNFEIKDRYRLGINKNVINKRLVEGFDETQVAKDFRLSRKELSLFRQAGDLIPPVRT